MNKLILSIIVLFSFTFIQAQEESDSFDVQLGEKLFKDDRFSQRFFVKAKGDYNQPLSDGDPGLEQLDIPGATIPHPLQGQQYSCASCHLVDQAASEENPFAVFAYNDFAARTLVPLRDDKTKETLRNSMNLVISNLQEGKPLHWDGEFFNGVDLTCATLVGRNMGWKSAEEAQAKQNIVNVIRKDDGRYSSDSDVQESYRTAFLKLGIKIEELSDQQVRTQVCQSINTYMQSLDFSRDSSGAFNGSAYDQFLELNGLRRQPKANESHRDYLQYIRDHLNYKTDWKFVEATGLSFHDHDSEFGALELQGMKVFFTRGQCASCHQPPEFTDFNFHNTGLSQLEYENVHEPGAFAALTLPNWEEREKQKKKFFVATGKNPLWEGVMAKTPSVDQPEFVDLGVWNVLGHPDKQKVQKVLRENLCESARRPDCSQWTDQDYLNYAMGAFKTTTLRDLGQTAPYFHNGISPSLDHTLRVYFAVSHMARDGRLVNPDPMLKAMHMMPHDFASMKAFLQSLDEDYD